jgi:hypothetical protein
MRCPSPCHALARAIKHWQWQCVGRAVASAKPRETRTHAHMHIRHAMPRHSNISRHGEARRGEGNATQKCVCACACSAWAAETERERQDGKQWVPAGYSSAHTHTHQPCGLSMPARAFHP